MASGACDGESDLAFDHLNERDALSHPRALRRQVWTWRYEAGDRSQDRGSCSYIWISSAFHVGVSRAWGDDDRRTWQLEPARTSRSIPFRSAETMTGHIVRISGGDLKLQTRSIRQSVSHRLAFVFYYPGVEYIQPAIVRRFREVYE